MKRNDLRRIKKAVQGYEHDPKNTIPRTQYRGGLAVSSKIIKITDNGGEPFYSWSQMGWDENNDIPEESATVSGDYDVDSQRAYDLNKNPDLPNGYITEAFPNPGGGLWFRSERHWTATTLSVVSNLSFTATLRFDNNSTSKTINVISLAQGIDVAAGKRIYVYWNGENWEMDGYAC